MHQNIYMGNCLRLATNYTVEGLYEIKFFARLYGVTDQSIYFHTVKLKFTGYSRLFMGC